MEHQGVKNHGETEDEEFPDEFQCCVCLDIMYKPVVLACGHISCFWCVYQAMDSFKSHCPVCRNPYNHFPRICELMHFLLLKLYPWAYKRRQRQVAEEEKQCGLESPQFDGNFQDTSSPLGSVPTEPNPACGGDHSFVQDSSQRNFHEDNTTTFPTRSSSRTATNEADSVVEHTNKALVTDLLCAVCKQLLCRPVVLNCGHVFCEACIDLHNSVCKCPVCQSAHPKGFPNVCLVLEHFLEEHFPEEYSARKASSPHFQSGDPSGSSKQKQEQGAQKKSVPTYSSLYSSSGPKFVHGAGCDYCGICPIIGLRYKCKDCGEKMSFDLCEDCYTTTSKLPGRFNQQHTEEHQFEVLPPPALRNRILSLGAKLPGEYDDETVVSLDDDIHIVYLSNDAPENELEIIASPNSPGDDPQDPENAMASPNPSNNHSEDRVDDSAT